MMTPMEMLVKCLNVDIPDFACPALMPPPGEIPLDPHAPDMWPVGFPVGVVCLVLVGVAMLIRIFTRAHLVKVFHLEDGIMIVATVAFFAFVSIILDSSKLGFGKHQWNVTVGTVLTALPRAYAAQIVYCIAMYLSKLGVLLQIKNTFDNKARDFMFWACWTCIVVFTCAYTANLFIWIFPCIPIRKKWDPFIEGHCNTAAKPGILSGVVNLTTDVALFIFPICAVIRLQMTLRKKLAITAIFATGLLACAASALRLYYSISRLHSEDITYWLAIVATCAMPEIAALLLCGSLPTFPRFFRYVWYTLRWKLGFNNTTTTHKGYSRAISVKDSGYTDCEMVALSQDGRCTKDLVP